MSILLILELKNGFLRESVAYPVLITAETPPPPRISTGGRAQMGGFKGCSKNFRVLVRNDEKTSKKMAEGFLKC